MQAEVAKLLAWLSENEPSGRVEIDLKSVRVVEGDGDELCEVEMRVAGELQQEDLAELVKALEQVDAAPSVPMVVVPPSLWLSLGAHKFAWNEQRQVRIAGPDVALVVQRLVVPSTCAGYVIHSIAPEEGLELLAQSVPAEVFSEVALGASLGLWLRRGQGVTLEVQAPPAPKLPPDFAGAFIGVQR